MAEPLGTEWWSHPISLVVRRGMASLSFGWFNLNPPSHVHRTTSFPTNVLHSNNSPTQNSHLVHHTEFHKLFFISNSICTNKARKWWLVWVVLQESMSLYPSCLQDDHILVELCISHPADLWCNAINTSFWVQYHTLSELQSPLSTTDTHLTWSSDSLEDYATQHKLVPFRKWVNLTHHNMFIHDPFEFTSVNSQKTWDYISQPDWYVLKAHCDMFHNPLLCFDVPSYSIHANRGAHVMFCSDVITRQLIILVPNANGTPGALHSPWPKVMVSWANHPIFSFLLHHYGGAFSEVWHAEVDYMSIHFAGESEKWESMEHYDKSLAFWLHF